MIRRHNITGTQASCTWRLDDRFDENCKKSKDREILQTAELWVLIEFANVNTLASINILKSCL